MLAPEPPSFPASALVIDDAPRIRRLLRGLFRQLGVPDERIFDTANGVGGFRAFRERDPDIVFLDVVLEGVQGDEVGGMMLTENPDANLVVVTALDPDDARVRSLVSRGALAVVEKPLDLGEVGKLVRSLSSEPAGLGRIPAPDRASGS